jgi:hypothetical protein
MQIVVVGSGPEAVRLEVMATARYAVNKAVIHVRPDQLVEGGLPEALAETVLHAPKPAGKAWALVCLGRSCMPPISDPEELVKALEGRGRGTRD